MTVNISIFKLIECINKAKKQLWISQYLDPAPSDSAPLSFEVSTENTLRQKPGAFFSFL